MNTRFLYWLGVAVLLMLMPFATQAAPDGQDVLTLERALQIAMADNPALAQAGARAEALAQIPPQAGALPDPVLTLGALNYPTDTFSSTQEAMTQMQIGVGVTLPFPGKLGLREQAADLDASSAKFDTDETRLVLARNVRIGWWNLFYLDRAIAIVQRNQDLLREFVKIAEAKYRTGQGMQSDVLLAQVELSKLLDSEISLHAARRAQAAILNSLLGRSSTADITLPQDVDESLPDAPDFALLHDKALQERPLLSAQRSELEAARTRVDLAKKDFYPDFKLGAAYGFRNGSNLNGSPRSNLASITLSMNLPFIFESRPNHELSQRRAEAMKEEYGLQDKTVQVDSGIEQALADYRAGRKQALLFKTGIIPQASQTAEAMLAAYQVDKVDFLNLIRAQVNLYNYETQYWKALSSSRQAWARLEAAVGQPLAQQNAITDKENHHVQ
jgi:cobalt-zinc-cadmium efflux system outer membrane protein